MGISRSLLRGVVAIAVLAAAWELVFRLDERLLTLLQSLGIERESLPDLSFVPTVFEILPALVRLIAKGEILPYAWDTVWRSLAGFLVGSSVGCLIGMSLGLSRRVEAYISPIVEALRATPPVALLPVMILFFGIGSEMKVVFVAFGAAWPVVVNTAAAFAGVEPLWIKVAQNLGHKRRSVIWRIMWPAALPGVFTGLRISLSISLILSIVSEMIAGSSGLGHYLNYSKRVFAMPEVFATIVVIGFLGWLLTTLFRFVDRRVLRWYYASRDGS